MARNSLTLRALNWMLSRQDEYVRYNFILSGREPKTVCKNFDGYVEKCSIQTDHHHRRSHATSANGANKFRQTNLIHLSFWTLCITLFLWKKDV